VATTKQALGKRVAVQPLRRGAAPRKRAVRAAPRAAARNTYHHGNLAQTLAEAGEAVLRDSGLHGFSLREAARRAGVAHSAPAHHFGDIAGLLTEIAARGFDKLATSMQQARAGTSGPLALARIGRGYVSYATGDPVIFGLLFDGERLCADSERLRTAGQRAFAELVSAVASARGVEDSAVNDDDLRFAWSGVHGLAMLLISGAFVPPGAARPARDAEMIQGTIDRIVHAVVTRDDRDVRAFAMRGGR
jgi:AcrR family transcriptional regulator